MIAIVLTFNNFLFFLIFADIILLWVTILLILFSFINFHLTDGVAMAIVILAVGAVDTAIGLGLFIVSYKTSNIVGFLSE